MSEASEPDLSFPPTISDFKPPSADPWHPIRFASSNDIHL